MVIPVTGQTEPNPVLIDDKGKQTKLTSLKWKSAKADWGQVRVDRNAGGQPLRINGKKIEFGIGAHANSVIHYVLPKDIAIKSFGQLVALTMEEVIKREARIAVFSSLCLTNHCSSRRLLRHPQKFPKLITSHLTN